jgi:archaellum component FlaC
MALTQREFDELVALLKQNPVLRKQLLDALGLPDGTTISAQFEEVYRQLAILTERINTLTASLDRLTLRVEELAEVQRRFEESTKQRFQQMDERFDKMEGRLDGVEQRLGGVEQEVSEVKQRLDGVEQRLGGVEQRLGGVEQEVGEVKQRLGKVEHRLNPLSGWYLEERYRRHAYAYFGRFLRQVRVVTMEEIEKRFGQTLANTDLQELYNLDLILRGTLQTGSDEEVFLAIEVSTEIEKHDVERAVRRAAILRGAGVRCLPVVGGERLGGRAQKAAKSQNAIVITDGKVEGWEEALNAY